MAGAPEGMSPTTAMPRPRKSRSAERATDNATTITGPGTGRREALVACSTTNMAAARPSDGQWIVAASRASSTRGGSRPSASMSTPVTRLELADEDRERDAREEADEDRPRQEGREHAEPEQPRPEVVAADDEREHGRDTGAVSRLEARHGGEDCREDGHRRGVGADDQLARRTEDGVGDERRDAGVEPGLRRQAGDRRVGDGTRKPDGCDGEAGGDIAPEPGRAVAGEARQDRPGRKRAGSGHHRLSGQRRGRGSERARAASASFWMPGRS